MTRTEPFLLWIKWYQVVCERHGVLIDKASWSWSWLHEGPPLKLLKPKGGSWRGARLRHLKSCCSSSSAAHHWGARRWWAPYIWLEEDAYVIYVGRESPNIWSFQLPVIRIAQITMWQLNRPTWTERFFISCRTRILGYPYSCYPYSSPLPSSGTGPQNVVGALLEKRI